MQVPSLEGQIETAKGLHAMVVLIDDYINYAPATHACKLCRGVKESGQEIPLVILAGGTGGLSGQATNKYTASEIIKRYLKDIGMPKETVMLTEGSSSDTLGQMVYSRPILDKRASEIEAPTLKIGIVTDGYNMWRSLWTAKRVLGDTFSVEPLPTEQGTSPVGWIIERMAKYSLQHKLWMEGIMPGDQQAFEIYMRKK